VTRPHFDWLAPHYSWIEHVTHGELLNWCRTALLSELTSARRVLVLGEGDGRFLSALLLANSAAEVDVVDASPAMVTLAQKRVAAVPGAACRVQWHIADARTVELPVAYHDLIVTNFFLDCFPATELDPLIVKLARSLATGGQWLVGDFALPQRRAARVAAYVALAGMYAFFNLTTRIPAWRLVDPRPFLQAQGLTLEREKLRLAGFLSASLWRL
jgi:ubiquinone/menaquinone biosynthesis C-methylase UbiE